MIDPTVFITQYPEYAKFSRALIQSYIDICFANYNYRDEILVFAVRHYLEIELNGSAHIVERTGDKDTIKFKPIEEKSFWEITDPGRIFQQLARRSSSLKHIRPR